MKKRPFATNSFIAIGAECNESAELTFTLRDRHVASPIPDYGEHRRGNEMMGPLFNPFGIIAAIDAGGRPNA
jgi:hypothetical protein